MLLYFNIIILSHYKPLWKTKEEMALRRESVDE